MNLWRAAIFGVLFAPTAHAQSPEQPTPAALEARLVGQWTGGFSFKDDIKKEMIELSASTDYRALDDGATVIVVTHLTAPSNPEGVYLTDVELFNTAAGTVDNVIAAKGRGSDKQVNKVSLTAFSDELHWTIQYEHDEIIKKVKSKVRVIETRDGAELSIEEDVMPLTTAKKDWTVRNLTQLTRTPINAP